MKPFLKWAGNKYTIKNKITPLLPRGERLIEPFAGSCAISLNTQYKRYLLAEQNKDLVNLYKLLQTQGENFIQYARSFFLPKHNCEEAYYQFRDEFNQTQDIMLRSALFLYLNKHGFNGLCRYNSSGIFNVPFGRFDKITFPEKSMLAFHEKHKKATFIHKDFKQTLKKARAGDVVYCDPPYAPLSPTSNFTSYTDSKFTDADQIALADTARELAANGIPVLISNHDTPFVRECYEGAKITSFNVQRYISSKANQRKKVKELIAVFD